MRINRVANPWQAWSLAASILVALAVTATWPSDAGAYAGLPLDPRYAQGQRLTAWGMSRPHGAGMTISVTRRDGAGRAVVLAHPASNSFRPVLARYLPDGRLDTSYGADGFVRTDLSYAPVLLLYPDGRAVLFASSDAVAELRRYTASGTLDRTFSGDGVLRIPLGRDGLMCEATLMRDGRVVFVGGRFEVMMFRVRPDGTLDPSFGEGGRAVAWEAEEAAGRACPAAMAVDPSNAGIVLAGRKSVGVHENGTPATDVYVARFNRYGRLDRSFGGGDGHYVERRRKYDSEPTAVMVEPSGRTSVISVAEDYQYFYMPSSAMLRLTAAGTPDPSFSGNGRALYGRGTPLEFIRYTDGSYLLAGSRDDRAGTGPFLLRVLPSGQADPHFGEGGLALASVFGRVHAVSVVGGGVGRVLIGAWRDSVGVDRVSTYSTARAYVTTADLGVTLRSRRLATASGARRTEFTYPIANNGPRWALRTAAVMSFTRGVRVVLATPSKGSCTVSTRDNVDTVRCVLWAVAASRRESIRVIVAPGLVRTVSSTVRVSTVTPDRTTANNTASGT